MTVQDGTLQRLVVAQKTDRGLKRTVNEDFCDFRIPAPRSADARYGALFVVADGVGSMGAGDDASRAAVQTLLASYYDHELDDDHPRERIVAAVQEAHEAVLAQSRAHQGQTLGTTLVGAIVLANGRMLLFNVGDSRIYRLRRGQIEQLTSDQSAIDPASGPRAKLTAYLGQPRPIVPHITEQTLQPQDTLILCSDGLWGLVEPGDIARTVQTNPLDHAVTRLVEQVYANGARDNVTIMLVAYRRASHRLRRVLLALIAFGIVLAAALFVVRWRPVTGEPTSAALVTRAATEQVTPTEDNAGHLVVRTPTATPN